MPRKHKSVMAATVSERKVTAPPKPPIDCEKQMQQGDLRIELLSRFRTWLESSSFPTLPWMDERTWEQCMEASLFHWTDSLRKEVDDLKNGMGFNQLKMELTEARTIQDDLQQQVLTAREEAVSTSVSMIILKEDYAKSRTEVEKTKTKIATLKQKIRDSQRSLKMKQIEVDELRLQLNLYQQKVGELDKELKTFTDANTKRFERARKHNEMLQKKYHEEREKNVETLARMKEDPDSKLYLQGKALHLLWKENKGLRETLEKMGCSFVTFESDQMDESVLENARMVVQC